MNNVKKYSWAEIGNVGNFEMVDVSDLKVDTIYQREGKDISKTNILDIARNFAWEAFGAILVMRRKNGRMYVVDGQHRVEAVLRRGDITEVPAIVFTSDGPVEEARAFYRRSTARKSLSAFTKFKARITGNEHPETEIAEWLNENGLHIADSSHGGCIRFPSAIVRTWKNNSKACMAAIKCQVEITGAKDMESHVHQGLWVLEHNEIDTIQYADKIMLRGGVNAMKREMNRVAIEGGYPAKSMKVCAMGILVVINYRKQRKVTVKGWR